VKQAFSDHSKAQRVFGNQTQTQLQDGLKAMASWVKGQGARESNVFSDIEVIKNMPRSWAAMISVL
jgi:UDP-glucose 4-epimerase